MPTLQFKGKNIIWNHHLSVPYHALENVPALSYNPEKANGNLIIEGDNLLALKALLPLYAGRIKCIYIDPPYNTGVENWIYNDNMASPLIRDWLGKEVSKDDLTRHDKWLCMITPRLKLLRDLLADDGIIFISIDDNELHHLRMIMNEIYGEDNFIDCLVWKKRYGGGAKEKHFVTVHEYVLVFAKNIDNIEEIEVALDKESIDRYYKLKDENFEKRGPFRTHPLEATKSMGDRPNLVFPIKAPDGNLINPKRQWLWSPETVEEAIAYNELYFSKVNGEWSVHTKQYLKDRDGNLRTGKLQSVIDDVYTQHGTNEMIDFFGDAQIFPFPKPTNFVKKFINAMVGSDDIVLDSFAGSGTTAQAILDLNKEDGGNRKFILVQMTESTPAETKKNICQDITRERVKRAIEKFEYNSGFEYMRVGQAIDSETLLSGKLPVAEQFGSYVFYLCTGEKISQPIRQVEKNVYLVGSQSRAEIYLLYSQDYDELTRLALNLDVAEKVTTSSQKRYIVYAPACFLDEDYLRNKHIEFVNIPYGLFQRKENGA